MKILQESKIILEVDVPLDDKEQIKFELDDDGNDVSNTKEKEKDDSDNESSPEPEEKNTDTNSQDNPDEDGENNESDSETNQEEQPTEDPDGELPPEDNPDEEEDFDTELPDENGEEIPGTEEEPADNGEESEETVSNKQNELISKERELFSDLTDKQLSIRDKELRGNYLRVYNTCNDIIENIKLIPKTSVNISVLSFINDKLEELKDFVTDYISNTYHTKTYLENEENYHYYIVILNKIDKLFKDLSPKKQLCGKYTK